MANEGLVERMFYRSCLRCPFTVASNLGRCLRLDVRWLASSELSVVVEETSLEHELKINSYDLGRGVGRVSGGGIVNRIFDLIDQGFERLVAVVGSSESLIIVL